MDSYAGFAAVYDAWSQHMTEDVDFYVELARDVDGPIVELAVGTGRVAIPVAKATGRTVIGVDVSPAMLAVARERAAAAGVTLDLRAGDMRELQLAEPAALITCPFRSLLHLPTWADRRLVFERVAASLRPAGRFAWNSFVFSPQIAAQDNGNGDAVTLWWVTRSKWEALIDVSGLEVEARYGWFDRRPFDDESGEFVWIARRPS